MTADQTWVAFTLNREKKTVCKTVINISSLFLPINYNSSWISQPWSTWDAPVLVPLNLPLLTLIFLINAPHFLHFLSLFSPSAATQTLTCFSAALQTCMLFLPVVFYIYTPAHRHNNALRAQDTYAPWSTAEWGTNKRIKTGLSAVCVSAWW